MKNVLVVDDEKFVRQGMKAMIERSGFCTGQIVLCKNGQEAIEQIKLLKFDVILSDIKMPFMDGIELVKKIRDDKLTDAVLVMITGYDEFSYAVEALRNGVFEYLLKPVERENFLAVLEKIDKSLEEKTLDGVLAVDISAENQEDDSKQQKIKRAAAYIQQNYNKDINMAVVSNEVSMNYTFFSETFKEEMGISFVDYLKSVRINMSKKLLRESCLQISRVAFEVGFNDEKHFSKTFKLETGVTPSEYKKNHTKTAE